MILLVSKSCLLFVLIFRVHEVATKNMYIVYVVISRTKSSLFLNKFITDLINLYLMASSLGYLIFSFLLFFLSFIMYFNFYYIFGKENGVFDDTKNKYIFTHMYISVCNSSKHKICLCLEHKNLNEF